MSSKNILVFDGTIKSYQKKTIGNTLNFMVWYPLYCGHQGCFEAPPFGKSFHWCPGAETGYPGYVSDCTFWMKFK
jgi:hypothetical protein